MGRVNFTIKNNLLHSHDPYDSPAQVLISNQPYTNVPSFPLKMNLLHLSNFSQILYMCVVSLISTNITRNYQYQYLKEFLVEPNIANK